MLWIVIAIRIIRSSKIRISERLKIRFKIRILKRKNRFFGFFPTSTNLLKINANAK